MAGLASLSGSAAVHDLLSWVWPPGAHIAADLHTLLDRAHVTGPYALAGHSFGGLYVLSFAAEFPDQVAGMVLLDSTAPKPGHDAKWQSAQDHLATLSTNSVHRVAKATTHESLIDDEADSAEASAAIHDVVAAVRTSHPLTR